MQIDPFPLLEDLDGPLVKTCINFCSTTRKNTNTMKTNWDVDKVISECQQMYHGANDPHVTGWNNWPCKQDLYRVKFAVDEMLGKTGSFYGEEEWLEQQQKEKMWKVLNDKM